jgi:hypothetical protein
MESDRSVDTPAGLVEPVGPPRETGSYPPLRHELDPRPRRKELRRLQGEARGLEPWERYRALNDAMDEVYEVMDHSNREARFALIVMGILNAFVAISASRPEVVGALEGPQRTAAALLLGVYAVAAMYFLYQAIEALRPGKFRPQLGAWQTSGQALPMGIRYYEDVIRRDALGHWRAWHEVQVGQLNAELAVQFHSLCFKSNVKRAALVRLFGGLRLMTMLVAALMVLFVYAAWI